MQIFTETSRLILREILPTDAEEFFEMDSDPEVHKYLGNNPVKDISQIHEVIQFIRQQYNDNGIGRWAMIEKKSNKFIGWTGLKLVKETQNNRTNYYDIGYRLNRNYWGQGYATESAIASMHYAFNILKVPELCAAAQVDNIGSNTILEKKLGMQFVNTFLYDGVEECNWYVKNNGQLTIDNGQ